jgi:Ca2+-binding RTX toxin-like protein
VSFSYTITDGALSTSATATLDITPIDQPVTPQNSAPTTITLSSNSLQEELPGGVIGILSVEDPDGDAAFTFTVSDPRFVIVQGPAGYQLKLADGAIVDYETDASVSLTITATDAGGLSTSKQLNIEVQDISGVTIVGSSGGDVIDANYTTTGQFYPTSEQDTIYGRGGNDSLHGLAGNDRLSGENGDDVLFGEAGDDTLTGGAGSDALYGGDGNDTFLISGTGDETDSFYGGSGTDTVRVTGTSAVTLAGFNAADSSVEHWEGNDQAIIGTSASDSFDFSGLTTITGLAYVDGGKGNDVVVGSRFADNLRGGAGNDRIDGAAGDDILTGAAGNDTFVFRPGCGHDSVIDFATKGRELDVIEFSKDVFSAYAEVMAASQQVGANVVITMSATDSITLNNVNLSKLNIDDFKFV